MACSNEAWTKYGLEFRALFDQLTNVKIIPDFSHVSHIASGFEIENGIPFYSVHESPMDGIGLVSKRIFDIFFSALALILLSPTHDNFIYFSEIELFWTGFV